MCLAIPMRIDTVDGTEARCTAKGIERTVSLFMLQKDNVAPGDYVLVHVGYAIQKISPADAQSTWDLLDDALSRELEATPA